MQCHFAHARTLRVCTFYCICSPGLLLQCAVPPCGSQVEVMGQRMALQFPLTLGFFFRLLHHLVHTLGYPAHWFAKYFGVPEPLVRLTRVGGSNLTLGKDTASAAPLTVEESRRKGA